MKTSRSILNLSSCLMGSYNIYTPPATETRAKESGMVFFQFEFEGSAVTPKMQVSEGSPIKVCRRGKSGVRCIERFLFYGGQGVTYPFICGKPGKGNLLFSI